MNGTLRLELGTCQPGRYRVTSLRTGHSWVFKTEELGEQGAAELSNFEVEIRSDDIKVSLILPYPDDDGNIVEKDTFIGLVRNSDDYKPGLVEMSGRHSRRRRLCGLLVAMFSNQRASMNECGRWVHHSCVGPEAYSWRHIPHQP